MTKFFYSRVSSQGQNLARQIKMANELGIAEENIYQEKQSGKNTNREQLQKLLAVLQKGDELYIESFSRLSRNLSDLLNLCNELNEKGVALVSLKEGECDTRAATGRLFFAITAAFAQYEREILAERRLEGQMIKRAKDGKSGGRAPVSEDKLQTAFSLYQNTDKSVNEICEIVGFKRATFYRYAKDRGIVRA
jgi:DNA invertase Pin-like site-specific DNA recombinase